MRTRLRENERFGGLPCKEDLIDEDECYVVPERPLCPDLPTAAPAAPLSTAGSTINSADDTRTAETGAAAETTTSAPISQELMHQVAKLAAAGVNPNYFKGILDSLAASQVAAAEAATAADTVKVAPPKMTAETAQQVARYAASGDIEALKRYLEEVKADPKTISSVLGNLTSSEDASVETALGNLTAAQAAGPKEVEVLRLEGNLYLYTPGADDFVANPKASTVIKDLVAAKAHVDAKYVEVSLSVPHRPLESEWQKKSKGNVRCAYKIHVYSDTGNAADGDAVMAHLKQVDEDEAEKHLTETCKASDVDCELIPVSMTMRPYRMP